MTARGVALGLGVLVSAVVSIAIATSSDASQGGSLSRVSNAGRAVSLRHSTVLRRIGLHDAALLAVRGSRALYRLEGNEGTCIGSGPADTVGDIGSVDCPQGPFPTAARPVLDLSVYESVSHDRHEVALYRVEGVAADGVVAIAFLRPNGKVALKVPVRENVFAASSGPGGPIAGLVALGTDGAELWRSR